MNKTSNAKLTEFSKWLRSNMTREERHLWYDFLKKLPQTVHRQKVIGKYIVDFYIADAKLAIELDGSQHYCANTKEKDRVRDAYLSQFGVKVLRYSNTDVMCNFDGVCADILRYADTSSDG